MKKVLALFLSLLLLVSVLSGCGRGSDADSGDDIELERHEYLFRDLPEAKYVPAAAEFAGGNGSEDDPYQISNAAELALLHEKMVADHEEQKNAYRSAHYVLTADIALNDTSDFDNWENAAPEYSWMPIGFDSDPFYGVFDGNGHTISGLYINTNCGTVDGDVHSDGYGLFESLYGTVKNVVLDKTYIAVSGLHSNVGSIAGTMWHEAVVEHCTSSAVLNCYENDCGGLVGSASGGVDWGIVDEGEERESYFTTISNCSFSGTITQVKEDDTTHRIGGIVGQSEGNVDACVNSGTITFIGDNTSSVGGIAGFMTDGSLSNCKNTGTLSCETTTSGGIIGVEVGGIVGEGYLSSIGSETYMSRGITITRCENSGSVVGQLYAGGIAGNITNSYNDYCATISDCVNSGLVASGGYTAGIIGYLYCHGDAENGDSVVVKNCENSADLSEGTVGGIIGQFVSEKGDVTIRNCKNSGALVSEGQHCAGMIAYWIMYPQPNHCNTVIDRCENSGSITSPLNAGGIVSFMSMPVCTKLGDDVSISISNCVNRGDLTVAKVNGFVGGILANWGMENIPTTVDRCTNSGTLSITAPAQMTAEEAEVMTISRIVGGIVGRVGPALLLTTDTDQVDSRNVQSETPVLTITNSGSTGEIHIVDADAAYYKNWFGGIIGNFCGEDGFSFFVDKCTYTGFDRGLGNDTLPDIGTKKPG